MKYLCQTCRRMLSSDSFNKNRLKPWRNNLSSMCRKCMSAYHKRTRAQGARKDRKEYNRLYTEKNRKMINAQRMVYYHIKVGHIKRKPCVNCGKKAHAHHNDYNYPLDIMWLCSHHHAMLHERGLDG